MRNKRKYLLSLLLPFSFSTNSNCMYSGTTEDIKVMPSQVPKHFEQSLLETITIDQAALSYGINLEKNSYFTKHKQFILYDIDSSNYLLFQLNDKNQVEIYRFLALRFSKREEKMRLYKKRMKQFKLWKSSNN